MRQMRTSTRLTLAYVGLATIDSLLAGVSHRHAATTRRLTKPLLMPTLAASLATDPRAAGSPLRTTTLLGQGFGCAGDVLLLGSGTSAFAAGAGAFGVGHAAYITGFHRERDRRTSLRSRPATRLATALFALGGPAMAVGAARRELALGPAVLEYTGLISAMLAHAQHLDPALGRRSRLLTAAGAALFATSDTLLGVREFLWRGSPQRLESVVMATYTAGQLLISKGAASA